MALDLRMLGKRLRRPLKILGTPPSTPPAGKAHQHGKAGVETRRPNTRTGKVQAVRVPAPATAGGGAYPGAFRGVAAITYSPSPDGKPDPGEIVWTWVPFEEDHTQGKDRPVVLVGHDGRWLLGLMLTSKDHDQDRKSTVC